MPRILPFQALRYSLERAGPLERLVAPPYDVVNEEERRRLLRQSPHNIVRLTLAEPGEPDFYGRVGATLRSWQKEGVLQKDSHPSFYLLQQKFPWKGRTITRNGFFALIDLRDEKDVVRHEITFDKYRGERTRLLSETFANLEPVFFLYEDSQMLLEEALKSATPLHTISFYEEEVSLFAVSPESPLGILCKSLAKEKVFVADGHHRFGASCDFFHKNPSMAPHFAMVYFANMADPNLLILPTHRFVEASFSLGALLQKAEPYFSFYACDDPLQLLSMLESSDRCAFGFFAEGKAFLMKLRDFLKVSHFIPENRCESWRTLDVVILHYVVMKLFFDLNPDANFFYDHQPSILLKRMEDKGHGAIFFLRSTEISALRDISLASEVMPPKSTFFYPKIPSGLLISSYDSSIS
ncbi:MAG: DUF1015 domain-containing protein [Candidatus Ratteibacteria bacterium]|jgi:uncharacterized protein (DUF1015 family)